MVELGNDKFIYKPLNMETVIEDSRGEGKKIPINRESTHVRRAKQGKRGMTTEENIAQ